MPGWHLGGDGSHAPRSRSRVTGPSQGQGLLCVRAGLRPPNTIRLPEGKTSPKCSEPQGLSAQGAVGSDGLSSVPGLGSLPQRPPTSPTADHSPGPLQMGLEMTLRPTRPLLSGPLPMQPRPCGASFLWGAHTCCSARCVCGRPEACLPLRERAFGGESLPLFIQPVLQQCGTGHPGGGATAMPCPHGGTDVGGLLESLPQSSGGEGSPMARLAMQAAGSLGQWSLVAPV